MAKKAKKRRRGPGPQARKAQAADRGGSRPARGKPTRAARIEAARRARRRKRLMVRGALGGIAVLLVVGVGARVVADRDQQGDLRRRLTAGSCTFDTRADPTARAPANHVSNPTYRVDPPAGGNHSPQVAQARTYGGEQVPPDGQVVHALEHGYVVLWHRPDLAGEERDELQKVADRHQRDVLVVPRPTLSTPVAATAWGRRLLCRSVEPAALDLFTREYRNKGPERVPHE
jgi:hypothetical protein